MNLFGKLFGKADHRTRLERCVDQLTAGRMNRQVNTMSDAIKVPYAQAMTVLLFARVFTNGLPEFAKQLPEPFKNDWPFPHDRIFAEVAGFYYFVLLKDFMSPSTDEEDWDEEDNDDGKPIDPYADALKQSLYLCSQFVHTLSDPSIPEMFVRNRAISHSATHRSQSESHVDMLANSILTAWNPRGNSRPSLDISAPVILIQSCISSMPIEEVVAACRNLYEEKARNPRAF